MIESAVSIVVGIFLLGFALLDTFPQIDSYKKLLFWMGMVVLIISGYALLSLLVI